MSISTLVMGGVRFKDNTPTEIIDKALEDISMELELNGMKRFKTYEEYIKDKALDSSHFSYIEETRDLRFCDLNFTSHIYDLDGLKEILQQNKQYLDDGIGEMIIDVYYINDAGDKQITFDSLD